MSVSLRLVNSNGKCFVEHDIELKNLTLEKDGSMSLDRFYELLIRYNDIPIVKGHQKLVKEKDFIHPMEKIDLILQSSSPEEELATMLTQCLDVPMESDELELTFVYEFGVPFKKAVERMCPHLVSSTGGVNLPESHRTHHGVPIIVKLAKLFEDKFKLTEIYNPSNQNEVVYMISSLDECRNDEVVFLEEEEFSSSDDGNDGSPIVDAPTLLEIGKFDSCPPGRNADKKSDTTVASIVETKKADTRQMTMKLTEADSVTPPSDRDTQQLGQEPGLVHWDDDSEDSLSDFSDIEEENSYITTSAEARVGLQDRAGLQDRVGLQELSTFQEFIPFIPAGKLPTNGNELLAMARAAESMPTTAFTEFVPDQQRHPVLVQGHQVGYPAAGYEAYCPAANIGAGTVNMAAATKPVSRATVGLSSPVGPLYPVLTTPALGTNTLPIGTTYTPTGYYKAGIPVVYGCSPPGKLLTAQSLQYPPPGMGEAELQSDRIGQNGVIYPPPGIENLDCEKKEENPIDASINKAIDEQNTGMYQPTNKISISESELYRRSVYGRVLSQKYRRGEKQKKRRGKRNTLEDQLRRELRAEKAKNLDENAKPSDIMGFIVCVNKTSIVSESDNLLKRASNIARDYCESMVRLIQNNTGLTIHSARRGTLLCSPKKLSRPVIPEDPLVKVLKTNLPARYHEDVLFFVKGLPKKVDTNLLWLPELYASATEHLNEVLKKVSGFLSAENYGNRVRISCKLQGIEEILEETLNEKIDQSKTDQKTINKTDQKTINKTSTVDGNTDAVDEKTEELGGKVETEKLYAKKENMDEKTNERAIKKEKKRRKQIVDMEWLVEREPGILTLDLKFSPCFAE